LLLIALSVFYGVFSKNVIASANTEAYYASHINTLLIKGSGFGAGQGLSLVQVGGNNLGEADYWTDGEIYFTSPSHHSGDVVVDIDGGSVYSAIIVNLPTYTSYPSDPDQGSSSLVSYWPFDNDFNDKKGTNNFTHFHNQLDNLGLFRNSYEAVRVFANDWRPLLDHDPGGNRSKRPIIRVDDKLLMIFYDVDGWQYTTSSDDGVTWSISQERPAYTFIGLPIEMENGEWFYWKTQGTHPNQELVFCHATEVTVDNIFDPPTLSCLDPIHMATLSEGWATRFWIQWQAEYFGEGRPALFAYKYFNEASNHGGGMFISEDYGHTWEFREISEGRILELELDSDITAGDTTIDLVDASDLYPSGTLYLTDGVNTEFVSYGAVEGNSVINVRYSQIPEYIADERLNENNPGTRNSYLAAGTTIRQDCYVLGEPTAVRDPNDSNHIIAFQRSEGRASSYIFKRESFDMGQTWTSYPHTIYLGDPTTAEPVRGNNNWAYWTADAGGEQGRIYIFTRHWNGTKYFYSDDGGETFVGNNEKCSYAEDNRHCLRTGNTWVLANDMNSLMPTADREGLWLFWNYANSLEASPPGDGELSIITVRLYFNHDDATLGKNMGYIQSAYSPSFNLSEYSLDFWINLRYAHKFLEGAIINRMAADGSAANYDIRVLGVGDDYNKIQFRQYNAATESWDTVVSQEGLSTSAWHHIAATYDGESIKLYINGVLDSEADSSSTYSGEENLSIGFDPSFDSLNFRGKLDNLKIWNRALSSEEALQRANWGLPVISDIMQPSSYCGTPVTVYGSGFGAQEGENFLLIGGARSEIISWSDTQIVAELPCSLLSGTYPATVSVSGYFSNSKNVEIVELLLEILPKTGSSKR
jgi:hypothetical protein